MAKRQLKVYVCGPYTGESEEITNKNVEDAIGCGLSILKKGHFPYIPHLTHFVDLFAQKNGIQMKWEEYIEWDKAWLEQCDGLLFLGHSKGADIELSYARKLNKTIFFSFAEIPNNSQEKGK